MAAGVEGSSPEGLTVIGGDFRISGPAATGSEVHSVVAWNATSNEYLAVWMDERLSATRGWDIFGRRVAG